MKIISHKNSVTAEYKAELPGIIINNIHIESETGGRAVYLFSATSGRVGLHTQFASNPPTLMKGKTFFVMTCTLQARPTRYPRASKWCGMVVISGRLSIRHHFPMQYRCLRPRRKILPADTAGEAQNTSSSLLTASIPNSGPGLTM
jgi:hypothetical protein